MVQQVVHGTRYIDEAVLEILEDGLVWVHQDANWNVLALTDFAGRPLERYDQTPYGIVTVDQESYFGDYDGDGLITLAEVDSNTNGSLGAGDACWGSNPSGACRVLDFDFDEDVDSGDKTVFDALVSADTYRRPGRTSSALGNTRAHQGLILDPEIGSFNNRARQYAPQIKRFMQRDPLQVLLTRNLMPPFSSPHRTVPVCRAIGSLQSRMMARGRLLPSPLLGLHELLYCNGDHALQGAEGGLADNPYVYVNSSPCRLHDPSGLAIKPHDPEFLWSVVHCGYGCLGGITGRLDCQMLLIEGAIWEKIEPDIWPDFAETPENQLTDVWIAYICCLLCDLIPPIDRPSALESAAPSVVMDTSHGGNYGAVLPDGGH